MVIPFETRQSRQLRLDRERRQACVQRFRRRCREWMAGDMSIQDLCADAADAVDGYAVQTLDSLRRTHRGEQERSAWIAAHYQEGISRIGTAIRDEIGDASARHAVAQTLQERVLRAELRFRDAMRPSQIRTIS